MRAFITVFVPRVTIVAAAMLLSLTLPIHAETVSLSNGEALSLLNALAALDGYDDAVTTRLPDGHEATQVIKRPYKLKAVRWALQHDIVKLRAAVIDYQEAIRKIEAEAGPDLADQRAKVTAAKQDLDLMKIKRSELDVESNAIPGTVLALLDPILAD